VEQSKKEAPMDRKLPWLILLVVTVVGVWVVVDAISFGVLGRSRTFPDHEYVFVMAGGVVVALGLALVYSLIKKGSRTMLK